MKTYFHYFIFFAMFGNQKCIYTMNGWVGTVDELEGVMDTIATHPYYPFCNAASDGDMNKLMQFASPDLIKKAGNDALNSASRYGKLEVIQYLLKKGVDPNNKGVGNETALESAIHGHDKTHDNSHVIQYLLDNGANITDFAKGLTILPRMKSIAPLINSKK